MIIKEIKSSPKQTVISFDDGSSLSLVNDVLSEFYLYRNKELSEDDVKKLRDFSTLSTHYQYVLRILSKANYSTKEIKTKLERRFVEPPQIDRIIKRLEDNNLLNDGQFAKNIFEYYVKERYGPLYIRQKLFDKGVAESIIETTLHFDEEVLMSNAQIIAERLINSKHLMTKNKLINQIYSKLTRYGYEQDMVLTIINDLKTNLEVDDSKLIKKDFHRIIDKLKHKDMKDYDKKVVVMQKLRQKGYSYSAIKKVMEVQEDVY